MRDRHGEHAGFRLPHIIATSQKVSKRPMFLVLLSCSSAHHRNVTLLFDSYEGRWFQRETDTANANRRMRVHIGATPGNQTAFPAVRASIYYPAPPPSPYVQNTFSTTGFLLADHYLLLFSPSPTLHIQESLSAGLQALNRSLPNATHAAIHGALLSALGSPDQLPIVTWLLRRQCAVANGTESCALAGTQRWRNSSLGVLLRPYDFLEFQRRWRSMLAVCGIGVALVLFTLRHERVRWSDVSPMALFFCQAGDYATVLLFYMRRDDFDIGGSTGFVLVSFWAIVIPFYFLAVRLENQRGFVLPPWPAKFLLIAGLLTGITSVPRLALLIRFSYWLPQIWYAAEVNCRRSVSLTFALGMNGGQLIFLGAFVEYHPMFESGWTRVIGPAVVWSALQIFAMMLQNCFGGAFFLPTLARKERFNWRMERPAPDAECPVCLEAIGAHAFLRTPCGHVFHDQCLREWAVGHDHPDCPVCRHALPVIDIDPTEA
jgi:hypothetical protein